MYKLTILVIEETIHQTTNSSKSKKNQGNSNVIGYSSEFFKKNSYNFLGLFYICANSMASLGNIYHFAKYWFLLNVWACLKIFENTSNIIYFWISLIFLLKINFHESYIQEFLRNSINFQRILRIPKKFKEVLKKAKKYKNFKGIPRNFKEQLTKKLI